MSLERNKLRRLVEANDLDGICRWVDEVNSFGRSEARKLAFIDAVDLCCRYAKDRPEYAEAAAQIAVRIAQEGRK